MTRAKTPLHCPFCHAVLAPQVAACPRCKAERRTRRGMSARGFRLFFITWMALALPLMLAACWVGFAPWGPGGLPPAYALALVGATPSPQDQVRCRVEVVGADGSRSVNVADGACGASAAAGSATRPAGDAAPSITQRRIATALHTFLCLLAGLLGSAALLPLVRRPFIEKSAPSWVRRATA